MKTPHVPMLPQQLPQQRIYAVEGIPELPNGLSLEVGYDLPAILKHPPRNLEYLFQAEWAWSPAHGRLISYFLHRGRRDWTLFTSYFDDNDTPWRWSPKRPVARTTIKPLDERQAAFFLTISFLEFEKLNSEIEKFHWINEEGYFSIADAQAIARVVWAA